MRRARVALLVAAHPDAAGTASTADVVGRDRQVKERGLDEVVVVAPNNALLIGVHRTGTGSVGLGLVGPISGLSELIHGNASGPRALLQRCLVRRNGGIEPTCSLGNEILVVPTLLDDVAEQAIEKRDVSAGLQIQVQDVCLAGDGLGDGQRHAPPGSTKMTFPGPTSSFPKRAFFLS